MWVRVQCPSLNTALNILMPYENPWLFDGKPFESEDIQDFYGFCYLIKNKLNGKLYIGRKYFYKVAPRKKGKRRVFVESDWKDYYSSSKEVQDDVQKLGKENFERYILSLHQTKGDVNFGETILLFQNNVLEALDSKGEKVFYNSNILGKYYYRPKNVATRVLSEHINTLYGNQL